MQQRLCQPSCFLFARSNSIDARLTLISVGWEALKTTPQQHRRELCCAELSLNFCDWMQKSKLCLCWHFTKHAIFCNCGIADTPERQARQPDSQCQAQPSQTTKAMTGGALGVRSILGSSAAAGPLTGAQGRSGHRAPKSGTPSWGSGRAKYKTSFQ